MWRNADGTLKNLSEAEYNSLTPAQQEMYTKDLAANRKAELDAVRKEAAEAKAKTEELEKAMTEQGLVISKLMKNGLATPKTLLGEVAKFVAENAETIKGLHTKGGYIEYKAVGAVTSSSATMPDGTPAIVGIQTAPAGPINLKTPFIDSVITLMPTDRAAYAYTDMLPKEGDAGLVTEGGLKPQIDFRFETRFATPFKIAVWTKLTEEAAQDIPNVQSLATDYLRKKHDLKRQNIILFSDGLGTNPKGLTAYGRVFSAGAMAVQVENPNIMDAINACIVDIADTHNFADEAPYMANIVLINHVDFFIHFVSAKDANGLSLFPTAGLSNTVSVGGVTIIPNAEIPTGKILVADASVYNVTSYLPYNVKIGWVNDDFIRNQFVILAESRAHMFVKKLDEQAIIYDDIATIKTAITKP